MKLASDCLSVATALLVSRARVLVVGIRGFAHPNCREVRDLKQLATSPESFDGVVLRAQPTLGPNLSQVRQLLLPEGLLIVLAQPAGVTGRLWNALSLGAARGVVPLEEACEALLLSGFQEPRVVAKSGAHFALSARKPRALSALDAFFEQPVA